MANSKAVVTRVPDEIEKQLPPADHSGDRAKFVLDAIKEKLAREKAKD